MPEFLRATVESVGDGAGLRWVGTCGCGWRTAPFLSVMQAGSAALDHVCPPRNADGAGAVLIADCRHNRRP